MPRRRNRLFTVFAVVIVILLYRVLQNSWDAQPLRPAVVGRPQPPSPPSVPDTVVAAPAKGQFPLKDAGESKPKTAHVAQEADDEDSVGAEKLVQQNKNENAEKGAGKKGPSSKGEAAQLKRPSRGNMPQVDSDSALTSGAKPVQEHDERGHLQRPLSHGTDDQTTTTTTTTATTATATSSRFAKPTRVHWTKPKEHFPLPKESIITLPTGTAKKIPRIQHVFSPEAEGPKKKRLQRQAKVREEIQRSWAGYRKYAWMHDELLPVSNQSSDPFCGWSATLVDSLDTLWIAGLKDEFDEAAKAAKNIDFTYTDQVRIPVFETTIRYLGGLIAAYDVSGGASGGYSFLLDKAVELAEVLMGIFDTPNRMPLLYYNWRPEHTSQPRRATGAGMAELATLSMEFTRLAQLTAQHKYYDAIDRITNGLIEFQKRGTTIPGLFPENLDISGCNRTATDRRNALSKAAKAQVDSEVALKAPRGYGEDGVDRESTGTGDRTKLDDRLERRALPSLQQDIDAALSVDKAPTANSAKSQPKSQVPLGADGSKSEWDCVPQGFVPGDYSYESYHMGGGQDSAYEYFGKEYLLLGGKEPKYHKLYEDAIEGINKYLLFRPMTQGDWDIIFPARIKMMPDGASPMVEYEATHLTCFIGGMYALGGKLFGREKDVEYAKKLTDGCVWAYQSTATGIMPEHGRVVPCPTMEKCSFNETLWRQALDPIYRIRDKGVREWEKKALEREPQDKQKQELELERQIAQKEKEARIEGLETLGEDDGDGGFQRETSNSDSPPTSASKQSNRLERRAAISVEPENVALISSDGTSSQTTTGKETSPNDDKPSKKAKSDELGDSDIKQEPFTHPSVKIPTLKDEYHSRPDVPTIPKNYPGRSGWPPKPLTHEEFVQEKIQDGIPPGYSSVSSSKYILRPEAVESVWYMYRITGDSSWMEKGWAMFEATMKATRAPQANSAIDNVLRIDHSLLNEMESFWLAETLKYYYLLFSGPDVISLDEWVLNTEAHPFKL
ncbi:class I alpha-mannosidase 1A [Metarhizium acridum CQMa 102]|uniref:alpha-1,2-Mannosidase n=1 Tax=Metarhizium acridum (strain CQMa 102) TaxID=655827 RepID=E9E441_METAQ|nr:class I alpha-mannosidase 1A [Metarhizium acridum CQMa 102]EFY89258.1 class I alpha-mannosidase 1A [Metarhizium acridum CQMa 102]